MRSYAIRGPRRAEHWVCTMRRVLLARLARLSLLSRLSRLALLATLGAVAACATSARGGTRGDRELLTHDDLLRNNFVDAYSAVQALRSNWLIVRGTDSFSQPSEIVVYQESVRLGGVDALRTLAANQVGTLRHLDGVKATARYGVGHGAGAIVVTVWTGNRPAPPPRDTMPGDL